MKARRVLMGMSQPELAEKTGIPQEHISRYERGVFTSMNPERLVQLAEALGVTTDYLLGRVKPQNEEDEAHAVYAAR
jgi:transcriptional regulator with XRE-family HTH domain